MGCSTKTVSKVLSAFALEARPRLPELISCFSEAFVATCWVRRLRELHGYSRRAFATRRVPCCEYSYALDRERWLWGGKAMVSISLIPLFSFLGIQASLVLDHSNQHHIHNRFLQSLNSFPTSLGNRPRRAGFATPPTWGSQFCCTVATASNGIMSSIVHCSLTLKSCGAIVWTGKNSRRRSGRRSLGISWRSIGRSGTQAARWGRGTRS